jgi:NAD(P)-dependent dehydrogenase (short-subunit alcohol dehydrogenase family)
MNGQQRLTGKTAIITGASKGLGKAMALALAAEGAAVGLVSRNASALAAVASEIQSLGGRAEPLVGDVSDESQVARLREEFATRLGQKLHILINNAGINIRKPVTEFTLDEWNSVMGTNVTSVFLMCRAFVPLMKGQGYGRIIQMTSMMSHVALPGRTAYAASKTALLGFNRALALELAAEKITVNGISPGVFATEMNLPLTTNAELSAQFMSKIPLARWGRPEEIGKLAVYLCSEDAGFITGTDIVADGGWTAQ